MKSTMLKVLALGIVCCLGNLAANSFAGCDAKGSPEMIKKGEALYGTNCASCHGAKGDGMGPAGKYMVPKPRNLIADKYKKAKDAANPTVDETFTVITKGLDGTSMPGFASKTDDERCAMTHYTLSFRKK